MKKLILAVLILLTLSAGCFYARGLAAETEPSENSSVLMQRKLGHAKDLLEGLALEDFDKIKASADELSLLSLEAAWMKGGNANYAMHNAEFRWAVEGIAEMADEENLEGATLKYAQVVITCVECHKTVRRASKLAWAD